MHSRSTQRRQAQTLRRRTVRRRRLAVLGIVPLVVLAVWAAYAWPATRPARVPDRSAVSPFAKARAIDRRIVVARLDDVEILLPVKIDATTAIAFHAVDAPDVVAFTPVGERADAGSLSASLADLFSSGGGLRYYQLGGGSPPTGGLDVGTVPGAFVYAPVDGQVEAVKDYRLLGRYDDTEVQIRLSDEPSLLLLITHVAKASVHIGDQVKAGETPLGVVRQFPADVQQDLRQVTTDNGDHVQLMALRLPPELSGF
jgi:murein DD-endopeptidase MepM/ murein hydrolase activator NlpD